MSEAITMSLHDNPDIKELLELLKSPGFQTQRKEYGSLLDGVEAIVKQYNTILTELDALKEKVGKITDRKNPLAVMVGNLENLAADVGAKLKNLKDGIISFTKNALDAVKEKGLSALGAVFGALHVRNGLQAMSRGLAKSAEALDKAVTRVDILEQHNREKAAEREGGEAVPPTVDQAVSLSELLKNIPLDFESQPPEELKANYGKLLAIGMDNGLTANELNCLQYLTEEAEALLPDRGESETGHEVESELDQGEEI
jgi:hypothetical protein